MMLLLKNWVMEIYLWIFFLKGSGGGGGRYLSFKPLKLIVETTILDQPRQGKLVILVGV